MKAPFTGRIGRALVDVGNLVGESGQDTVLAHLVETDPIHVDFAPTERDRLDVIRGAAVARYSCATPGVNVWKFAGAVPIVRPSVVTTFPVPAGNE